MNNIEYSRLVMKRTTFSGVTPTVNTGDTIDNSWSENDILNAELFYNLEDQKLYTRSGGDIVLLANGTTNLTGSTTCCPLEDVLSVGNTTGFNWIDVNNNYGLKNISGINERYLTFGNDDIYMYTTDGTNEGTVSLANDGIFKVTNTNEIYFRDNLLSAK